MAPWQGIVGIGLVVVGTLLVLHALNEFTVDGRLLAIDSENGFGAWYSATQFYAAGVLAAIAAFLDRRARIGWLAVGLCFLAFSVDDVVQVHEASERVADSRYSLLGLQPVIVLLVVGALVATSRRVDGVAVRLLRAAAGALVVAFVMSAANGLMDGLSQAAVLTLFGLEESAEMLTGTFVLAAAVDRVSRRVRVLPATGRAARPEVVGGTRRVRR